MTEKTHLGRLRKRFEKTANNAAKKGGNFSKITRKISLITDVKNISEGLIPYDKVQLNTKITDPQLLISIINASKRDKLFVTKEDKQNNIEIRQHI